jgi:hypothetical protein
VQKRLVIWSPACSFAGAAGVVATSAAAAGSLAGGYFVEKDSNNAGACEVVKLVTEPGTTDEFRWWLV